MCKIMKAEHVFSYEGYKFTTSTCTIRESNLFKVIQYVQATKLKNRYLIYYPRVDKDLFIFAASFKRSPSAPELFCLNKQ